MTGSKGMTVAAIVGALALFLATAAGCSEPTGNGPGEDKQQSGGRRGYLDIATDAHREARKMAKVEPLQREIKQFRAIKGRYPRSLEELAEWRGMEVEPPRDMTYNYDPQTGQIEAVPEK